ncbi:MAG: hypothetical protein ACOCXJ_08700, partial [Planctomycetota bacterium]
QPRALEILLSVARCSRYGLNLVLRDPRSFWGIVQDQTYRAVYERHLLMQDCRSEVLRFAGAEHRVRALLRFHQYHILRIMIGDLRDHLSFEATVREISDLAEVCAQVAYELAVERLRPRYGTAGCAFCVLALGKLGGRELNYSSDLDLIFIYERDGQTTGGDRELDHAAYFMRLGKELIRILDEPTSGGRFFRIDMRLRPQGASGELVLSLRATVDYYDTSGRPWERQALIKARPVAGDHDLGDALLQELRPWVFPRQQSLEHFENARAMRKRIEERAQEENVKTGAGGIRDIEFLVQFFQLVYGGDIPDLRHRSTLVVLRRIADLRLITREEAQVLEEHYIWLRNVEHRLQLWEARQLHDVPDARAERLHLARRCGCDPTDPLGDFERRLDRVRRQVRELADRYYLTTTDEEDALFFLCTGERPSRELTTRILGPIGFADLERAVDHLRSLAREPFFVLSRHRTERNFLAILPQLLRLLQQTPDADDALREFVRIVQAVGGRSWFYKELAARPRVFETLVSLAGWATFLVQYLERFPGLIDDLLERLGESTVWDEAQLQRCAEVLGSGSDARQNLAYLQARELVNIAWRDLQGTDRAVLDRDRTALARALLQLALDHTQAELDGSLGCPVDADGRRLRYAVFGLGKLGSGELSYASDMDVIMVCDPGGRCSLRDRDAEVYWRRLLQGIIRLLGEGRIYEIDLRLRPWGDQGPLVVPLPMLQRYWQQERDLWERLAMTRCAALAGDARLGAEAVGIMHEAALGRPLPDDAARQVRDMRARLEQSVAGRDHLKRGYGGYVDIEFTVQYLSLQAGPQRLPPGLPVAESIAFLNDLGLLPDEAVEELGTALHLLRRVETRMRLAAGRAISSIPTDPVGRLRIARQSGFPDVDDMNRNLHHARERARGWFDRLVC